LHSGLAFYTALCFTVGVSTYGTVASAAEETCLGRQDVSRSLLQTSQKKSATAGTAHLRACVETYADGLDDVFPQLGNFIRTHPLQAPATSTREIIFDAGSGTTATKSLQAALDLMNFTGCHLVGTWAVKVQNLLGWAIKPARFTLAESLNCTTTIRNIDLTADISPEVDYIIDTPIAEIFIDLFLAFPNAKWLLSTRPAHTWAVKRRWGGLLNGTFPPVQEPCGLELGDFSDETNAKFLTLHQNFVRCVVPSEKLFEYSVFEDPPEMKKTLMQRMSAFLGRKMSGDLAFPQLSDDFSASVAAPACFK